ncbi:MAG: tRNA glutamyl-Q(34) synthetase GluQRS [Leptothrix sp. (in: b-proteobacteria)]
MARYVGRFAPSPTGALHAGSLVAALASWLDARAQGGRWLVRIEDVDTPRCLPGAAELILQQLAACGLVSDAPPEWQSRRGDAYARALARLQQAGLAYACTCTRQAIDRASRAAGQVHQRHAERVYPGTCRPERGAAPAAGASAAWRLHTGRVPGGAQVVWLDRRLVSIDGRMALQAAPASQPVDAAVGDFVLRRADGVWAYQLAVVVDDAAQGVTDVVRGADLADNTARQILLQRALGLPTPRHLHAPLVLAADGQKLSKQNGAAPINLADPAGALRQAGAVLGLALPSDRAVAETLAAGVAQWAGFVRSAIVHDAVA